MVLYHMTSPARAPEIMQEGFQEADVNQWAANILGYGVIQLYDVRPGPGGGELLSSRRVNVNMEGVEVTPGPMLSLAWTPPDNWRWLRVNLDLPDDEIAQFKVEEEDTPEGLSFEEVQTRIREGAPWAGTLDWGYGEYMVPLYVLQAHARIEGPFTCDAETDDAILESTVVPGEDLNVEIARVEDEVADQGEGGGEAIE